MTTSTTLTDKTLIKLNVLKYKLNAVSHNQLIECLISMVYKLKLFEELKQELYKREVKNEKV